MARFKSKQKTTIEKNKKGKTYMALTCRPSGQPSPPVPPLVIFLLCQYDWACARRTRAPPPPCLAAPSLPWAPPATPRTPRTLSLSLDPSSSSALPPSRHRTHLRAPLAVAMTTGHPLSRDRAQQLRNRAPHPQAEGNEPEGFASSPTSSSSPLAPGDRLRRFVGFRPSPRPLTFSTASL